MSPYHRRQFLHRGLTGFAAGALSRLRTYAESGHWIEVTDLSSRLRKIEGTVTRIAPKQEADVAGFHFAEETRYDAATARIENVFTFSRDGGSETKLASQSKEKPWGCLSKYSTQSKQPSTIPTCA